MPQHCLLLQNENEDLPVPNGLDALGVIFRLELVPGLVHVAHVAFLSLQDAGQVHLQTTGIPHTAQPDKRTEICWKRSQTHKIDIKMVPIYEMLKMVDTGREDRS